MTKKTTILAIETSCDETALALVQKQADEISVLDSRLASQVNVHALTGGVVPNIAAREHATALPILLKDMIDQHNLSAKSIDAVAVTVGPGLQPALAMGVTTARTLAFAWQKPIVPVHHIEGHIYSALLQGEIMFPALALIVSGGHTLLIHMTNHLQYRVVGSTRDDAAGEVFDKVARLLGLAYPGGSALSRLAEPGKAEAFSFPRPMIHGYDLDMSFSGLKTAVLYQLQKMTATEITAQKADLAASFQQAIVDTLTTKVKKALERYPARVLLVAGGVAANEKLRQALQTVAHGHHLPLRLAPLSLCGDNAIMIGQVALFAFERGRQNRWQDIDAQARIDLSLFSRHDWRSDSTADSEQNRTTKLST